MSERLDCIHMSHDWFQWQEIVNTVMYFLMELLLSAEWVPSGLAQLHEACSERALRQSETCRLIRRTFSNAISATAQSRYGRCLHIQMVLQKHLLVSSQQCAAVGQWHVRREYRCVFCRSQCYRYVLWRCHIALTADNSQGSWTTRHADMVLLYRRRTRYWRAISSCLWVSQWCNWPSLDGQFVSRAEIFSSDWFWDAFSLLSNGYKRLLPGI